MNDPKRTAFPCWNGQASANVSIWISVAITRPSVNEIVSPEDLRTVMNIQEQMARLYPRIQADEGGGGEGQSRKRAAPATPTTPR
jgi:hypothetical protein